MNQLSGNTQLRRLQRLGSYVCYFYEKIFVYFQSKKNTNPLHPPSHLARVTSDFHFHLYPTENDTRGSLNVSILQTWIRMDTRLNLKQFSVPSVKVSCYCQCNISPCQVYIIELFVKKIVLMIVFADI